MGDDHNPESISRESSSDTSDCSTKTLPPTGPSSPQAQHQTILTRSRLNQIVMQAPSPVHDRDRYLCVDDNGTRPGDDSLLTQHFYGSTNQSETQLPRSRKRANTDGTPDPMAKEVDAMHEAAQLSRTKRLKSQVEREFRSGKTNGTSSSTHSNGPPATSTYRQAYQPEAEAAASTTSRTVDTETLRSYDTKKTAHKSRRHGSSSTQQEQERSDPHHRRRHKD